MTAFHACFPTLFHVTDRAALPGIARHVLLSAERLCTVLGIDGDLGRNRGSWRSLATPAGCASLRRQGMRDGALRSRLDPSITLEEWRRFINAQVFLCPSRAAALVLRRAEPDRDQVLLACATAALMEAGCALRFCTFNNGYIDRSPAHRRRLRSHADYRPVSAWAPGTPVREVAIKGAIPLAVRFEAVV